jgi:hypothetical protein
MEIESDPKFLRPLNVGLTTVREFQVVDHIEYCQRPVWVLLNHLFNQTDTSKISSSFTVKLSSPGNCIHPMDPVSFTTVDWGQPKPPLWELLFALQLSKIPMTPLLPCQTIQEVGEHTARWLWIMRIVAEGNRSKDSFHADLEDGDRSLVPSWHAAESENLED